MSKPDLRAIVDVKIDFITQNVYLGNKYDCHQTDEWKNAQRGKQDCLMDRVHLCGNKWDFTSCLFINQLATFNIDDNMRGFNATVEYCSYLWGIDSSKVKKCAYSDEGARLLRASHEREEKYNPNSPHINWITVDGVNFGNNENADWVQVVCDAYTGSPKPASCPGTQESFVIME